MTFLKSLKQALRGFGLAAALAVTAGASHAAGLLVPSDGTVPALEIRDHEVSVVIEDGYAITQVEQVFHNPHARDLEARYSFPVPEHGSVAEFTVWIDGRPVTGEVLERQRAREVYAEEKAAGREAGITEKDSYRTFDTRVSPIRAGQDTRIRLVYLQPAAVDTGIGRYVYPLEEGGVDERKLAFWKADEAVTGRFRFDLQVRSAYPVDAVRMPNQPQAVVTQEGAGAWRVSLDSAQGPSAAAPFGAGGGSEDEVAPAPANAAPAFVLDQDLVVYWRHQAGLPGTVDLVAHKPAADKRGTFMLVVTPGDDLAPVTEGRDWVFVLDVSGSMKDKYATLADGVERALGKLRPEDRFRIVLFNDRVRELTPGFVNATHDAVLRFTREVAGVSPGNGTNLYAGLDLGLEGLDADRTSALVLVTDGVANVGETRQRAFLELIDKKDVRLFTFVMGNSANRPLLEAMTRASHGFAASISNSDDIVGQLLAATSKVTHQALHGVTVEIDGVKTADLTPVPIGSLYRGQQLVLFGHYWGAGEANVALGGKVSGQPRRYATRFAFPGVATGNPEIERLWAYSTIERAMEEIHDFGETADLRQRVVDLGVEYGLVTDYTAMVVVREEVFAERGIGRSNRDRLALEQAAREQRAQQAPVSRRVDAAQPMTTGNRASHNGGGALDAAWLLLLAPLAGFAWRRPSSRGDA